MPDLLEQLAELPLPPPPSQPAFDRSVHERINNRLIVSQVIDLCLRGFGYALWHFGRATFATIRYTFTGKYAENNKNSDLRKNGQ